MRFPAVCVLLFAVLSAAAQDEPKKIVPIPRPKAPEWTEIKCEPGVPITLAVDGAKDVQWILIDELAGSLATAPGSSAAVFNAPKAGRARVLAIADGKPVLAMLVAGNAPPGPPGPPGPPNPPAPVDELTKKLQVAYDVDPGKDKAADLRQLIALYSQAVEFAKDRDSETAPKTVNDLFGRVTKAAATLLPTPPSGVRRLDAIRKLVAADLNSVIPTDEEALLTDDVRSAAAAAFDKYAKALLGVSP